MKEVSFADINYLVAQAMSNATATMRFPGMQNNSDIRKLCTNLIPFPILHLITQGQAPLIARGVSKYITLDEGELTKALFDPRSFICEGNPKNGRFLTGSILYRGENVSGGEVDRQIQQITDKHSKTFVEWIPNRLMTSICSVSPPYKTCTMSGSSLFNSTTISHTLERVLINFDLMYNRKAFLHQYLQEGMDLSEFDEARANICDLISEYQQYQEMGIEEDYDNEGEGEDLEKTINSMVSSRGAGSTRPTTAMSHQE